MKNQNKYIKIMGRSLLSAVMLPTLFFILMGCESQPTELSDYDPQPVLTAYLFNGEPVDSVVFERVGGLYSTFTPGANAISGADIYVIALDKPGRDTLFFDFDAAAGVYRSSNSAAWGVPESNAAYRVEAHHEGEGLSLWAETVIPDTFTMVTNPSPIEVNFNGGFALLDTMTREDPNIELFWTNSNLANGYVITVTCLEDTYIPLDPDFDPDEDEISEDSSRVGIDVVLQDVNYRELAWLMFNYEGLHEIQLQAADTGYWNYFFSVFRLYTGQITSVEYNVNGGLGIVAGLARNKCYVYVKKAE